MDTSQSLYEGRIVRLGPIDFEKDPEVVARWSRDPFLRMILGGMDRPLSPEAVKKKLEKIEKRMEENKNLFNFMVRDRRDDRLVGMANIYLFDLSGGTGRLSLGIGDPDDRRHGFGSDALHLLLRFAFGELNLHRLSVWPAADNIPMIRMVEKAGFEEEVRRREASFHNGEYWDLLQMGLLQSKWERQQ